MEIKNVAFLLYKKRKRREFQRKLNNQTMKILTQDHLALFDTYTYNIYIYRNNKPVGDLDIIPADEYVTIMAVNEMSISKKTKRLGIYPYHVAKEIMLEIAIAMFEEETEVYIMPEDPAVSSCEELEKILEQAEKDFFKTMDKANPDKCCCKDTAKEAEKELDDVVDIIMSFILS